MGAFGSARSDSLKIKMKKLHALSFLVMLPALLTSCANHSASNDAENSFSDHRMKKIITILQSKD